MLVISISCVFFWYSAFERNRNGGFLSNSYRVAKPGTTRGERGRPAAAQEKCCSVQHRGRGDVKEGSVAKKNKRCQEKTAAMRLYTRAALHAVL